MKTVTERIFGELMEGFGSQDRPADAPHETKKAKKSKKKPPPPATASPLPPGSSFSFFFKTALKVQAFGKENHEIESLLF